MPGDDPGRRGRMNDSINSLRATEAKTNRLRIELFHIGLATAMIVVKLADQRYELRNMTGAEQCRTIAEKEYADLTRLLAEPQNRDHMSENEIADVNKALRGLRQDLDRLAGRSGEQARSLDR